MTAIASPLAIILALAVVFYLAKVERVQTQVKAVRYDGGVLQA